MSSKSYTALGWIVWQIGSRVARRKLSQNRSKLLAAGVVAAVVAAGIALASGDDDS
jgi:hypothetical protein